MAIEDRMTGNDFCKLMERVLGFEDIVSVDIEFTYDCQIFVNFITGSESNNEEHTRDFNDTPMGTLWQEIVSAANLPADDLRSIHITASLNELAFIIPKVMTIKPLLGIDWSGVAKQAGISNYSHIPPIE